MLRRKNATKIALVLSVLMIFLWLFLGTRATVAWFQDDDTIVNSLNFGDFKVELYHKTASGYEPVDSTTKVFDDAALYEPGYTQVVYLKIKNAGTIDFKYDMSIIPDLETVVRGSNVFGREIYLPNYLKCGFVFDTTEEGLLEKTADRNLAQTYVTQKLSNYSQQGGVIAPNGCNYCALILYMPESVGNEANYRGDIIPSVDVGISVKADQIR